MPKFSSRQAAIFASVILMVTLLLSYLFRSYEIVVGGLLVTIFFTVFIERKNATYFAGIFAIAIMTATVLLLNPQQATLKVLTEHIFSLLIVVFTMLLVLYLKRLQQHLRFEKIHMTSLFENATEGIILTNRKGAIVLSNPAAEKMFGYAPDEMIGQTIDVLIPQKIRKGHEALREKFHEAPSNRSMGSGRDLYAQRRDGIEFPVEVSLSHYKENNETFVIAFIVDITHRKNAELVLLQQKEELQRVGNDIRKLNTELEDKVIERTQILKEALEKLEVSQQELSEALIKEKELGEMKSRFVSIASHEFRTPLTAVLSSASLAAKYKLTEEQDKREKHLERIKVSVKHLNDILEDFLSVGKMDEGKLEVVKELFDLKEWLTETIEELKVIHKKDQQLVFHYEGDSRVVSDKRLLKNILINLVSNAIKFSPEGSSIHITSTVKDRQIKIIVADKGIGIAKEEQVHLFSSFFRGKNAQNIQGTGLGLHIVERYVALLQGNIQLESELNEGTTIGITIPA